MMKTLNKIVDNDYIAGISNVFITLLPVSLVSAFSTLLGQGANHLGFPALSYWLIRSGSAMLELFPVLLVVYYSQFLASKHQLQRVMVIIPTVFLYFTVNENWGMSSELLSLPSNYLLAIIFPIFSCLMINVCYRCFPKYKNTTRNLLEESLHTVWVCLFVITAFIILCGFTSVVLAAGHDVNIQLPTLDPHSIVDGVFYEVVRNLLWVFGLNGHLVLAAYKQELFQISNQAIENYRLYGEAMPILSSSFYDIYAGIGGAGNTLCLALSMLLFSKKGTHRKLALAVLPLGIFNINEPIIYGLPIMFNPILIIPFLLTPVISLVIAFSAITVGLVPAVSETINWMTPVFLSGYLATEGALAPVLLQFVLLCVGIAIYTPFLRAMNSKQMQKSKEKVFIYDLIGLQAQRNELKHAHSLHQNLDLINAIGERLSTSDSMDKPAMDIFRDMQDVIQCDAFAIGLFDKETNHVYYHQFITADEQVPPFSIDCNDINSLTALCVKDKQAFFENSLSQQALANKLGKTREQVKIIGTHNRGPISVIYVPIELNGELLGVVTCQSQEGEEYKEFHFSLFKQLASYLAVGLKNLQQREQLNKQKQELHKLATTDPLTKLYNRQSLSQLMVENRKQVSVDTPLGMVLIDIDYFKQYNDTYGHIPGDQLLTRLAVLFQELFPEPDCKVIRYGGDEVLILVNRSEQKVLEQKLAQLKHRLAKIEVENKESPFGHVTLSVGAALFTDTKMSDSEIIHQVDEVLYQVKRSGRNNYLVVEAKESALT